MEGSALGSSTLLRRVNAASVVRTIRAHGPVSRSDIARMCGLSKPTVGEITELLLHEGLIRELAKGEARGPRRSGPRPRLLAFRGEVAYVVGVDIGADKILVLVSDMNGDVVAVERRATGRHGPFDAESLRHDVLEATEAALTEARVGRDLVRAIGIGTPGVIDPDTGRVTLAPQLPGWEGVEPARIFDGSFDCHIRVDKELHLAVVGEQWRGAARGIADAVYVQLGVGIGAGILVGGAVYRGACGGAGEIGYLPIGGNGASPEQGFGSLEWEAGGTAFARLGREAAVGPDGDLLLEAAGGDPGAVDARAVFEALRRGSPAAARVVETIVGRLARAIASVACVLNPSTILIGGGISRAGPALLDPLTAEVERLIPFPPELVLSDLGDEAVAFGALKLAIDAVESDLFAASITS